jgi:SpoVK/Ycf46/Vps4 family AAA+-type ATPase
MSIVSQSGRTFTVSDLGLTHPTLPKGVYILRFDQKIGFFLEQKEDFQLPSKIYGDHSIVNRWQTSWKANSEKNMGILLSGIKGSGKTITAQKFCIESELPVILITEAWQGDNFVDFITNPTLGEFILFVDEFEKVYSKKDDQQSLLSIMDGAFPTKIIFLLTVNTDNLNEYLFNRLNRIKYLKTYSNLDYDLMEEVIQDLLINKDHVDSVHQFFSIVGIRTFDLLVNLIKEMNLFNEDAIECGKHLNIRIEQKLYQFFEILSDGTEIPFAGVDYFSLAMREVEIRREKVSHLPGCPKDKDSDEYHEFVSANCYVEFDLTDAEECAITRNKSSFDIKLLADGLHLRAVEHKPKSVLTF